MGDIQGGLSMIGLMEYLQLWDCLGDFILSEYDDQHIWKFEAASGQYSTKLAYIAFFSRIRLLCPLAPTMEGLRPSANSFYGWPSKIDVGHGQQIDWLREVSITQLGRGDGSAHSHDSCLCTTILLHVALPS